MALSTAFRNLYDLSFQATPIILTGGSMSGMPGSALPILALVGQLAGFSQGLLTRGLSSQDYYARWLPMQGATVINNSVAVYPFANQHVAANAYIKEPLNISLHMIAPVKDTAGYLSKLAVFTSLVRAVEQHIVAGGTFAIATPSFIYEDCLLTGVSDMTRDETKQQQIEWRWDFFKPLITQEQATNAKNGLMQALTGGMKITGAPTWSAGASAVGKTVNSIGGGITGAINAVSGALSGGP